MNPASGYDAATVGNRVFTFYREISLRELLSAFRPGDHLLELGGGTADEALALAEKGFRVLVTDVSPVQMDLARKKIHARGLQKYVDARAIGIDEMDRLVEELGGGFFDGAFSSFGALNCVGRPDLLAARLHALLRPEGRFVCSVMNRICAWEILSGLVMLKPGRAFRRLGDVTASIEGLPGIRFNVRYFSPGDLGAQAWPGFRVERMNGYPLLPPPYLDRLFRHVPGFLRWASRREGGTGAGFGDHIFATMRRC